MYQEGPKIYLMKDATLSRILSDGKKEQFDTLCIPSFPSFPTETYCSRSFNSVRSVIVEGAIAVFQIFASLKHQLQRLKILSIKYR